MLRLLVPSVLVGLACHASDVRPFTKAALVTVPAHFEVAAPPDRVWAKLATAGGIATLGHTTVAATDADKPLTQVGDHVPGQIWTDHGNYVVTWANPGKDLRIAFAPENASYICELRVTLTATAAGTTVDVTDRYTDDQPDVDGTAKKAADELTTGTAAFRQLFAS